MKKKLARIRRSKSTRARIEHSELPRLMVHRTNLHIYASVISPDKSKILVSVCQILARSLLGSSYFLLARLCGYVRFVDLLQFDSELLIESWPCLAGHPCEIWPPFFLSFLCLPAPRGAQHTMIILMAESVYCRSPSDF